MRPVDADALLEYLQIIPIDLGYREVEEIEEYVKGMPTIEERKRGKWIVHYECPKCGEITKDFMEYCPFCNADMRGE